VLFFFKKKSELGVGDKHPKIDLAFINDNFLKNVQSFRQLATK
jgi:hypothetical protein